MKTVISFFVVLVLLPMSFGDDIRVMSFNVRYGTANDGANAWEHRRELVLVTIQESDPDLLGTQEMLPLQAAYLQEKLPEYSYIGWTRDASKDGEQCGIFYRKARFEIVDSGQFWLSETPDTPVSKSWDSSLPRVVTWAFLQDREAANRQLVFANTHFDHRGETARQQSAKLIRRRMAELVPNVPLILTGDFNCGEGSPAYETLVADKMLRDSFRVMHPTRQADEGTFHGFSGKSGEQRIDWILHTAHFQAKAADIIRKNTGDRYPSDHFAISTVLTWDVDGQ